MNTHLLSTLIYRRQAQGGRVIFLAQCGVVSRDGADIRAQLTTISELVVSRQRQRWWIVYQSPCAAPARFILFGPQWSPLGLDWLIVLAGFVLKRPVNDKPQEEHFYEVGRMW